MSKDDVTAGLQQSWAASLRKMLTDISFLFINTTDHCNNSAERENLLSTDNKLSVHDDVQDISYKKYLAVVNTVTRKIDCELSNIFTINANTRSLDHMDTLSNYINANVAALLLNFVSLIVL
jgi:hypothetical protein